MNEWINIKNRLPSKNEVVLAYRGNHIGDLMNTYTYLGDDKWEDDFGYWNRTDEEGITHWMYLPAPPRDIN